MVHPHSGYLSTFDPHIISDAVSGNGTRATLVGGECSHHCAIPAPLKSESERGDNSNPRGTGLFVILKVANETLEVFYYVWVSFSLYVSLDRLRRRISC